MQTEQSIEQGAYYDMWISLNCSVCCQFLLVGCHCLTQ